MNTLSWLIYGADVASTVDVIALAVAPLTAVGAVACLTHREASAVKHWDAEMANHVLYPSLYSAPSGERPDVSAPFRKYVTPLTVAASLSAFIWAATPSRNTLYAIAASELGEQALKSATGTKAIKALDAWLDKQIAK